MDGVDGVDYPIVGAVDTRCGWKVAVKVATRGLAGLGGSIILAEVCKPGDLVGRGGAACWRCSWSAGPL